ncbi:MAG: YidC/Oxa1 family membrane protein insertase [Clostridia bacterium]|nr:YidC/Oxa1 family membrane protein insertase [Clostridia bacterium]
MGIINLLSTVSINSFGNGFGEAALSYEWICRIIEWIVKFAGDVGLGIILFTVALKLITLPLDIFSRASMKKNSLKMEMMKGDLEKLQKQYANNQALYQQKMTALYKKNGYSAFSACLPTIVTLVFFFIVLGAFNSYSRYSEKEVFNEMGRAYTETVESYEKEDIIVRDENDEKTFYLNANKVLEEENANEYFKGYSEEINVETDGYLLIENIADKAEFLNKYSLDKYFREGKYNTDNEVLTSTVSALTHSAIIGLLNEETKNSLTSEGVIKNDVINDLNNFYEKVPESVKIYFKDGENGKKIDYDKVFENFENIKNDFDKNAYETVSKKAIESVLVNYRENVIRKQARDNAADAYYNSSSHSKIIPWVKTLWVVDSPFSSALKTYDGFSKSVNDVGSLTENAYEEITYNLSDERLTGFGKGNGYFILVALSILAMLGSTVVMNKTQKAQTQLSSVDGANGTAASTQKMMTWMMPIMFGIFAFIYSASFSLYMITSTVLSTVSTLIINFFVERSFKNKIEKEMAEKAEKQKYGKKRY